MAERVSALPATPGKYPWEQWADGTPWHVRRGKDFDNDPENFRVYLHQKATALRTTVRTRVKGNDVWFQFGVPPKTIPTTERQPG